MPPILILSLLCWTCFGEESLAAGAKARETDPVPAQGDGLHGYIGFSAARPPAMSGFSAGMGFYSAVWPLVDQPLANFQIGLAGSWITPDNSDDKDTPLAPEGTLARTWRERGPTWESVFQTVEGGLGYWAGNHFRYGLPKFSMNATPQCYDYEVGSPGWSFFYSNEALPDNRLAIAQLSNRLLIPPDALPFQGSPTASSSAMPGWPCRLPTPPPETRPLATRVGPASSRGQFQRTYCLLHPGDLEQDRQTVQIPLHLQPGPRCPPGQHGGRRDGNQHRAPF